MDIIEEHPHVLLLGHLFDGKGMAKSIVKPDTKEYYRLCSDQHTVYHDGAPMDDILTDFGLKLYQSACKDAKRGKFKGSFTPDYKLVNDHSGNWFPDKESKHYSPGDMGMLNSFSNVIVVGRLDGIHYDDDMYTQTSPCIFIKHNEWVLTKSGSLYELSKGHLTGQQLY